MRGREAAATDGPRRRPAAGPDGVWCPWQALLMGQSMHAASCSRARALATPQLAGNDARHKELASGRRAPSCSRRTSSNDSVLGVHNRGPCTKAALVWSVVNAARSRFTNVRRVPKTRPLSCFDTSRGADGVPNDSDIDAGRP
ncbi:hypothetical protein MTO96_001078 [Rhipicephalus appendiculatus]